MIPFPWSLGAVLAAWPVGWTYARIGRLDRAIRRSLRTILFLGMAAAPLATAGPPPVQLTLGIVLGYLAVRMVALEARRRPGTPPPGVLDSLRELASLADLLEPRLGGPRPASPILLGVAAAGACATLMLLGARWGLWRVAPPFDDFLVLVEVGLATMAVNQLIRAGAAGARGQSVAGLQDAPMLSASLTEFWGSRWNRLMSRNLERAFARPLLRRGHPWLAIGGAFAGSALFHAVPVLAAGPLARTARPAALVAGYFLLHGLLVIGERRLGIATPPRTPRRLLLARLRFNLAFVLLALPFIDVYADVCGVHGRTLP